MKIAIVNAGLSEQASSYRLGEMLASELLSQSSRAEAPSSPNTTLEMQWLNLRSLAHDIVDTMLTGLPTPKIAQAQDLLSSAQAVIALTPTYQASYSGLFKSFFDILDDGTLSGTPVLIAATGGTPRHALVTESALRPLFIYMHAQPLPTAIYVATEDWGAKAVDSTGDGGTMLESRVRRAAHELLAQLSFAHPHQHFTPTDGTKATNTPALASSIPGGRPPAEELAEDLTTSVALLPHSVGSTGDSTTVQHSSEVERWPGFIEFEKLLGGSSEV